MLAIALYQPEIPPNTGNIIRLCVNSGAQLHLIKPLGFELSDKQLRRAGLDYLDLSMVTLHQSFADLQQQLPDRRIICCTTKATTYHSDIQYQSDDILLFGPETRGLPADILQQHPIADWARIPMRAQSRSLNLSNAVAIILYEAWRQIDYL